MKRRRQHNQQLYSALLLLREPFGNVAKKTQHQNSVTPAELFTLCRMVGVEAIVGKEGLAVVMRNALNREKGRVEYVFFCEHVWRAAVGTRLPPDLRQPMDALKTPASEGAAQQPSMVWGFGVSNKGGSEVQRSFAAEKAMSSARIPEMERFINGKKMGRSETIVFNQVNGSPSKFGPSVGCEL